MRFNYAVPPIYQIKPICYQILDTDSKLKYIRPHFHRFWVKLLTPFAGIKFESEYYSNSNLNTIQSTKKGLNPGELRPLLSSDLQKPQPLNAIRLIEPLFDKILDPGA